MKLSAPCQLLLRFTLTACVLAVLLTGAAQAQSTTAALRGTVTDEAGEPLPGTNVVAVHQPTGTQYGASTNAEGRYNLQGLRVGGPYRVTASFVGYRESAEEGFDLTLGQTRTVDFNLISTAQELEELEVVGATSSVLNTNRTGAQTNISEATFERLPTIERSLSDFARLSPFSTGRGGNGLAGRNDRYNNIQIDGATLNDVFGLGDATPGSQAGTQPISLDAIQEFNVDIAPYDVRYSGFTGGSINAITKSGTNAFEGSLRYRNGGEYFVGDFEGDAFNDFQENLFVGTLGGPIVEDKVFFFASAEVKREGSPVFAGVGTGRTNDFDLTSGELDMLGFDSETDLLNEITSIAESNYGYNPGGIGALDQREDNVKFLAKLDWNIADAHRLTLRHNYVDASQDNSPSRGQNSYALGNRAYVFNSTQNSSTVQLNSTLGNGMFNEARFVYTRIRDTRDVENQPFPDVTINLTPDKSVNLGIDRFSQANALDQDLFELSNDFTWALGEHELTLGTSNQAFLFSNLFVQDYYGQYEFDSFEEGETEVSAVDAFRRGLPTVYRYSYAIDAQGAPTGGLTRAEFTGFLFGLYAQDEWSVTPRLNLTAGLRADVPYLPEEPTFNPTAYEAFGLSNTQTASGFDNLLFSPRFGFNYDATGLASNFSTQLRGGTGVFSGRPPFVWISNQYSNTGADYARVDASLSPSELEEGACFSGSGDPNAQPLPDGACAGLSPVQTTEINLITDDFNYPQTWRTNLAVDQELPGGFIATLEGIYSNTLNDVVYRNINLEQAGASKYGRPLYGTPGGFRAASRNLVSDRFTNALLLENTSEGYEWSASAQLQREMQGNEGFSGSLSYTMNRATNVNNGTSSRAISNWQFNENLDVNNPRLGTADFEVRHRVLAYGSYRLPFGPGDRFATTIGLVYDGNSGAPYSWIVEGDANADGESFNDLAYVPESEDDLFLSSENWDLFNAYIEGEESLDEARGTVVKRNTANAPWVNILDLQLGQEIATVGGQRVEINASLENLFAFADEALGLSNDLGTIRNTSFNNYNLYAFEGYVTEGDVGTEMLGRTVTADDVGKPIVNFEEETVTDKLDESRFEVSTFSSRWRLRLGLRYTF